MVPFAGYEMPVEYKEFSGGVLKEHLHVREHAGLFDVSHMGQLKVLGRDRVEFMNYMTVADVGSLAASHGVYSLLMNETGGIKDDTILTKFPDYISMVVNGACKHKDLEHLRNYVSEFRGKGKDVELEYLEEHGLLAVQGPKAAETLQRLLKGLNLNNLKFLQGAHSKVQALNNAEIVVTRCGYTGEDGFELSVAPPLTLQLAELLLTSSEGVLKPIGLGARDSLRLEAGLCLYGHDLDESTSPVEANLLWCIPKEKRNGTFLGGARVVQELAEGVQRKRVGFTMAPGPSAREGAAIYRVEEAVGTVTSGAYSPLLKHPIGMGYVRPPSTKPGSVLAVAVRDKKIPVEVTKMPFTKQHYVK